MKLLYLPFSIVSGVIAARVGRRTFAALWEGIADSPKPSPTDPHTGLAKLAASSALEAATLAVSTAVFSQISARLFQHLFGVWPHKAPEPDKSLPA